MANTPFKLKSGNTTSFKDMGSSPVKQNKPGGGAGEVIDHWDKYRKAKALKQDAAVDKLLTKKNISKIDFEKQLAKITKTVDPYPKKSTTLSRTTKAFSNTPKQLRRTKKSTVKQGFKKGVAKRSLVSKVVGKAAIPLAVGEFMYGAYKSGQKSSGGRYGFEQNPSYDPTTAGPKHGDASANAKFIPTQGRAYKDVFSIGESKIIKPKKKK